MPAVATSDGRRLEYETRGRGDRLVCHPGGPGFSGSYLGGLAGLDRTRELVLLHPRGTAGSDPAASPEDYTLEDYVADLEELRVHLELDGMDLLGHSHGSLVAALYAARHPERVRRLVLVTAAARFQEEQVQAMQAAMQERAEEPWFEDACAALEAEEAGEFRDDAELGRLVARELPFYFARYGEVERSFVERTMGQPVHAAALRYFNLHEFTSFDLRSALGEISAPTLVIAGEKDFILGPSACREVAEAIPNARLVVLPEVGHLPWVEDPEAFVALVDDFVNR